MHANIESLNRNYGSQLNNYVDLINKNSDYLEKLRSEYALSSKAFNDLSIKNHALYMRIAAAKHERDLQVGLDERHKIEMLIVDT